MILPTKRLSESRALLTIGADVLRALDEPKTVSGVWENVRNARPMAAAPITFDWFILSLDLLCALRVIELDGSFIIKRP